MNQTTLSTHPPRLDLSSLDTMEAFGSNLHSTQERLYESNLFRAEPRVLEQIQSGCFVGFGNSPLYVHSTEFKSRIKKLRILEPSDIVRGEGLDNNYMPHIPSELLEDVKADCTFLRKVIIRIEPWRADKEPLCNTLEAISRRYRQINRQLSGRLYWNFEPRQEPCPCHSKHAECPACMKWYLRNRELLWQAEKLRNQRTFVGSSDGY